MRIPTTGEIWQNNRNGEHYEIVDLYRWSDTPDNGKDPLDVMELELWVGMRNRRTGLMFCRSLESFHGENRNGDPRFMFVC